MSSYDQNLLDEAPRATRAQLQEGYNVDLLEHPPRRTPSVRNPPPQTPQPAPATVPLLPTIAEAGSGEKFGSPTAPKPRTTFWRSRAGIITVVLVVLIVIGAVVGGAVGGTIKQSSNVDTTGTNSTSGSTGVNTTGSSDTTISPTNTANSGAGTSRPLGFDTSTTPTASSDNTQAVKTAVAR